MASLTKSIAKDELPDLMDEEEQIAEKNDCTRELQCIGLRISYFRRVRNMTQAELAAKVGINKNYLSHIECGNTNKAISLPLLIHISRALKVKLAVLVDLDDWTSDEEKNSEAVAIQEMRQMFDEMCQLNEELDRAMEKLDDYEMPDQLVEVD